MIDVYLSDNTKVRYLFNNGRYHKYAGEAAEKITAQEVFMATTKESTQQIVHSTPKPPVTVFQTVYKQKKKSTKES